MLDNQFQRVVRALLQDLDTPVSRIALERLEKQDWDNLFAMKVDPAHYTDAELFFRDYQAVELLRKLDIPDDVEKLKLAAEKTFWDCERECLKTNLRLNPYLLGVFDDTLQVTIMDDFVQNCKKFISDVLGPLPRWLDVKFGPGATFNDKGRLTTIPDKMSSQPTATCDALHLKPLLEETAWFRALYARGNSTSTPQVVPGNRFTTVPKDATKRRGICIEPSINLSLQLAVGGFMKKRLKGIGIDLLHGQQLHRSLAREASLLGSHATVDLSNASDTVSYSLVKLMLPNCWFELLDTLRSPCTLIGESWVNLHKFSSMGNGFTFELETLIFCAILHGIGLNPGKDSYVYGDDLIIPSSKSADLLSALKYFGFTPNTRKTFVDGDFRESCGGDFFCGTAVRPHYIKELPNEPQDWIKLANGLRRVGLPDSHDSNRWHHFHRAWLRCLDALPVNIRRLRGPRELGDLVIHDTTWESRKCYFSGMSQVRVYKPLTEPLPWHHWTPDVQLASALYGVPSEGPVPRDNVSGYKVGWVTFS